MTAPVQRIASIDQFRGYAVLGMIFVNYCGRFDVMPWTVKHHEFGYSYADSIAPLFIFVVGMGLRMSLVRRISVEGFWRAHFHAARRALVLILIGIVVYGPEFDSWRYWWDALVDIGFGTLLALPFLLRGIPARVAAAGMYLVAHQCIYSLTPYGEWNFHNSINGGPAGILPWAAILLFGTIAQDLIATSTRKQLVARFLTWGVVLSLLGWAIRMPWPGIKEEWPFSQPEMTMPYPLYSAGLCFLTYLPFFLLCDVWGKRLPHLTELGMNPLVLYIVHILLMDAHGAFFVGNDATLPAALASFAVFYLCCYAVAWRLHKDRIIIKL